MIKYYVHWTNDNILGTLLQLNYLNKKYIFYLKCFLFFKMFFSILKCVKHFY